jgi:glutathione peroxidase-family protein
MTGGVTNYREIVTEDDIEAAKKQIQDNLILMAKEDLRTYIDEVNTLNQTNLILLDDSRYLKTELVDIRISDDLEGSYKEKFELFAKISAEGVAFNFDQLFTILKKELSTRTHPNMQLREDSIAPENITYEVIDEDELLGQIKITATVIGIEEYIIDESTAVGSRFGTKAKEKVLNLDIEEAESLIGNLPEVDAVEIKTWPMWISSVPRLPESIEIKLME